MNNRFFRDAVEIIEERPTIFRNICLILAFAAFIACGINISLQFQAAQIVEKTDFAAKPRSPFSVFFDSTKISVGSSPSRSEMANYLRGIGYSETAGASVEFSPGSFCLTGSNGLRLRSNHGEIFPDVLIEWKNKKISKIVSDGKELAEAELEARPINTLVSSQYNEDNSDVIRNTKVIFTPARNNELHETLTETTFLAAEGSVDPPVSVKAFIRAAYQNYFANPFKKLLKMEPGQKQGGSSPPMQIAKNAVTHDMRDSFIRKIYEVYIASELSRRMNPSELFEVWANHIPFGVSKSRQNIYGVETAAKEIFGKKAEELNISEASFLAALIPSPMLLEKIWSKKDDARAWKTIRKRQEAILKRLRQKYPDRFTEGDIETAAKKTIKFAWDSRSYKPFSYTALTGPFMQVAEREFSPLLAKQDAGEIIVPLVELKNIAIRTRLNEKLTVAGQKRLINQLPAIQSKYPPIGPNGKRAENDSLVGVISMTDSRTGEVLTLTVGSASPRLEISSAFVKYGIAPCSQKKTFDYSCAIEKGKIDLLTEIDPQKGKIRTKDGKIWQPATGVGKGPKSVGECFTGSDDGCAAYVVGSLIGLDESANFYGKATGSYANPMVSLSGEKEYPAINAIGFGSGLETNALQFNEAFSIFSGEGNSASPRFLSSVYINAEPATLLPAGPESRQVISPETAYIMFWLMRGVMGVGPFGNHGTARNLKISKYLQEHPEVWLGCKTGSGQHNVGITCVAPQFTVTVQLFYPQHSRFRQVGENDIYAAGTAGVILSDFLLDVLKLKPELFGGNVAKPDGIVDVKVDVQRKCRSESGTVVPFKAGTEPGLCAETVDNKPSEPPDESKN